jgi:hypothetical protein
MSHGALLLSGVQMLTNDAQPNHVGKCAPLNLWPFLYTPE